MFNTALVGVLSTVSPTTKVLTLEGTGTVEYYESSWGLDPDVYGIAGITLTKAPLGTTTVEIANWCDMDSVREDDADYSICHDVVSFGNLHTYAYGDAIPIVTKVTTQVGDVFVNWKKLDVYEQMLYGTGDTYTQSRYHGGGFIGCWAYGDNADNSIVTYLKTMVGQTVTFKFKLYLETNVVCKRINFSFAASDNIDTTQRFFATVYGDDGNALYTGWKGGHYLADADGGMYVVGKRGDSGKLRVRSYDDTFDSGFVDITFDDESDITVENAYFVQTYNVTRKGSTSAVTYLYTFKVSQNASDLSGELLHDRAYVSTSSGKDYFQFKFDKQWKGKPLMHHIASSSMEVRSTYTLGDPIKVTLTDPV